MAVKDRILMIIAHENLTNKAFERKCGLSNGYVNNFPKGVSYTIIEKILSVFPEIDRNWLVTGEGEMLKEKHKEETPCKEREMRIQYLEDKITDMKEEYKELKKSNLFLLENNLRLTKMLDEALSEKKRIEKILAAQNVES